MPVLSRFLVVFALFASVASGQNMTGVWEGTWSGTETEPECGSVQRSGQIELRLVQAGSAFHGSIRVANVANWSTCPPGNETVILTLSGSVSGSSVMVTVSGPDEALHMSGNVSGDHLTLSFSGGGTAGSATLMRTSSGAGAFTGAWNGSYTFTGLCSGGSRSNSGPATVYLVQSGSSVSGALVFANFVDVEENCSLSPTYVLAGPVSGSVSGNSMTATFFVVDNPEEPVSEIPFSATVSGDTLSGSGAQGPGSLSLTVTRTGGAAAPVILSFAATPASVRPGQSVSLTWTTSGATSASIDHGVGTVPVNGSAIVTPNATTTYVLTATNASGSDTASVVVEVSQVPEVAVSKFPGGIVQQADTGGATDTFALTNSGGAATTITLSQSGDFFTVAPASFDLAPGGVQNVTITAAARPEANYEGAVTVAGTGVPTGTSVPVRLLAVQPPSGPVTADATSNRVDVSEGAGVPATGSVGFTNTGTARLVGAVISDSPWLGAPRGAVLIEPGVTATITFTIDPLKRPDAESAQGSIVGSLQLVFPSGPAGKVRPSGGGLPTGSTTVTVSHTLTTQVTPTTPPPLQGGEIALFLPGVGHVFGGFGALFISDVGFLNREAQPITEIQAYFTPRGTTAASLASIQNLAASQPLVFSDMISSIFQNEASTGSLQIRTAQVSDLSLNANILNIGKATGSYGTTIPVFRSDRGVPAGGQVFIPGLRRDDLFRTNVFLQETSGAPANLRMDFLNAEGVVVGNTSEALDPFELAQVLNPLPPGAVATIVTNEDGSAGRFLAYATPVDNASGDAWSVADWGRVMGFGPSEIVVIPVAGAVHGALNTYFRTDFAVMNTTEAPATGRFDYFGRAGERASADVDLGPLQSRVMSDVIQSLFGITTDSIGYVTFTTSSGSFAVTSRTYTTEVGKTTTYGTAVPPVPVSAALRAGTVKRIGGLDDASIATISAGRPGTFRTNVGLVEVTGAPATVRLTLSYIYPLGRISARGTVSREYPLAAREFRLISVIANELLGSARTSLGDLRNLQLDFEVVSGEGAVIPFATVTENGTNDTILRLD